MKPLILKRSLYYRRARSAAPGFDQIHYAIKAALLGHIQAKEFLKSDDVKKTIKEIDFKESEPQAQLDFAHYYLKVEKDVGKASKLYEMLAD